MARRKTLGTRTNRGHQPIKTELDGERARGGEPPRAHIVPRLVVMAAATAVVLGGMYWALEYHGGMEILKGQAAFRQWIDGLGAFGPIAVIGAMTLAIVFSPIPSAPIALAAGAAYGHGWGTLYVLLGSGLGALSAFFISRVLGYQLLRYWFGERLDVGLLGSQNALMVTVFLSRMLPFISFDIVSYAAGLTKLKPWRFALATFAGILPASFVLAHFGDELSTGDLTRVATTVFLLGFVTVIPLAVGYFRRNRGKN